VASIDGRLIVIALGNAVIKLKVLFFHGKVASLNGRLIIIVLSNDVIKT
jgi:hypothetical protein